MYQKKNYVDLKSHDSYLNRKSYNFTDVKKQAYTILYIVMLIFISVSILLYVSQSLKINEQSTRLMNLEKKLEKIKAKNEQLEFELASKTSLTEIERIAKNKLNMVEVEKKETIVYNNQFKKEDKYLADIPKEKFFLVQIYDKIIKEVSTVQAESLE